MTNDNELAKKLSFVVSDVLQVNLSDTVSEKNISTCRRKPTTYLEVNILHVLVVVYPIFINLRVPKCFLVFFSILLSFLMVPYDTIGFLRVP